MKKLSFLFSTLLIAFWLLSCSSVLEPNTNSDKTSITLDLNKIVSREIGSAAAEISITIKGDGINKTKKVYYDGGLYKETFQGDFRESTLVFEDIPSKKNVTIEILLNDIYYNQSYSGKTNYITGTGAIPEIALTKAIPVNEEYEFHIKNEEDRINGIYSLQTFFQNKEPFLSDIEIGQNILLILDEDITLTANITPTNENNLYYYINLNGHKLTLNSGDANSTNFTIGENKNLLFFNGTITTDETQTTSSNIAFELYSTTSEGGTLFFKNIEFTNLKNRIVNCYGAGTATFVDCKFLNCERNSLREDTASLISFYPHEDPETYAGTLQMRNTSFNNCKTYNDSNSKALIRVKGTAYITDSTINIDYSDKDCVDESAAAIELKDNSNLYLNGTAITLSSSDNSNHAIYVSGGSFVYLDGDSTNLNASRTTHSSSINAQNAIKLTSYVEEGYNVNSYLIIANNAMLSGTVNFEGVMDGTNTTQVASIPKICTVNYTNKSKIKLNITFKDQESTPSPLVGDTRIIITPEDEIIFDEIDIEETISHITLLNEKLQINEEGELELAE